MTEKGKAGHRQRLRDRFLADEPGSRGDEVLLELLLTYAIPRQDVRPLAHELLKQFGNLSGLLAASLEELYKCKGVKESSVVLLKAIDEICKLQMADDDSLAVAPEKASAPEEEATAETKEQQTPEQQELPRPALAAAAIIPSEAPAKQEKTLGQQPRPSSPRPAKKKRVEPAISSKEQRRKFQVSNGYLLEFEQLARVLHSLQEMKDLNKINRKDLMDHTGLADRQLESLISVGSAMGLINRGRQTLSTFGEVVALNDIFVESRATLEWCHYVGAASFRNLIWYESFNTVLADEPPGDQETWLSVLRRRLEGQYTDRTIGKHLREEVRFVVDAYLERNFRKLELLHKSPDDKLYRRRYTKFEPLVLCAMLYDFGAAQGTQLLQVGELATTPGSPAVVFGVEAATLRQLVESLHNRGWIRYETTHNLDQIRLKVSMTALDFLRAYYEHREPQPADPQDSGELF